MKTYIIKDRLTGSLVGVIPLIYTEATLPLFFTNTDRPAASVEVIEVVFKAKSLGEGSYGYVAYDADTSSYLCGNPKRGKSFLSTTKAPRLYMTAKNALTASNTKFDGSWSVLNVIALPMKAPGL